MEKIKQQIKDPRRVDGTPIEFSYYIYFENDANGTWKIKDF